MKSYTDIEQSKKLAEILPLESADMMYHSVENEYGTGTFSVISKFLTRGFRNDDFYLDDIPCWSLTALLAVIPYNVTFNKGVYRFKLVKFPSYWECYHENFGTVSTDIFRADNPIDACVSMIERLHELKML